jgi:putative membrane protein
MKAPMDETAILAIERPDKSLWTYYLLCLLAMPPLLPILILPVWFRFHTMRYKFTREGISMSWGILFRKEIILNYARIQDIHLRSNLVERWLGLARILIQTASGNSSAELTLEGLKNFEMVRDFLYSRMRGVHEGTLAPHSSAPTAVPGLVGASAAAAGTAVEGLAPVLREIRDELRALRKELEVKRGDNGGGHV